MTRRTLLAATLATPLATALPRYQVLTGPQAALLTAICDRIIPADQDAGAVAAGVVEYIDRQLAGPLARFAPAYRTGLAAFPAGFLELEPTRQTASLEQIESGEHGRELAAFFRMTIDHTMQGFYGPPEEGGNRHDASWKMLGIDGPMTREHA